MARDMETRPEMPRTDGGIEYLASTIMSIGPPERRVGQCRTSPLGSETGVRVHAFFMYVFDFFRVKKDTVYPSRCYNTTVSRDMGSGASIDRGRRARSR